MALELLLTGAVLYFSVVAINASSQAHIARVSAQVNCEANNNFRSANIQLWLGPKGILAIADPPNLKSPAAVEFRKNITESVQNIYKARACPSTTGTNVGSRRG